MFNVRTADLDRLNSITKYPSIPTYHALDPQTGRLLEEPTAFAGPVLLTEKVDGTNARVVRLPDGAVLVGSRNEWLHALGDVVANSELGIVEAVRALAERVAQDTPEPDTAVVYWGEVFGGKVTSASGQYTGERRVGFRLFDAARIAGLDDLLARPSAELALWREGGGQGFLDEDALAAEADRRGVALTPRVGRLDAAELPQALAEAEAWLRETLPRTRVALDAGAAGRPEGLVLRTPDRATIAKARLGDYQKTLRQKGAPVAQAR